MSIRRFTERDKESHKGTYGRALLVGGSRGMAGAIALSSMAALRGGAGLVTVATADVCLETVAGFHPCLMTIPLPDDDAGRINVEARSILHSHLSEANCIGIGPGLGQSEGLVELIAELYQQANVPMVFDADALNCLAQRNINSLKPAGPRVLTPHLGEFRRLIGNEALEIGSASERVVDFAKETGTVVLLKGHKSLVTDGAHRYENKTGNPGMATAGSGDVLTGLITALICQHFSPYEAACTAAHIHGLAGDFAAESFGQVSMTSQDIIDALPAATKRNFNENRRIGFPV